MTGWLGYGPRDVREAEAAYRQTLLWERGEASSRELQELAQQVDELQRRLEQAEDLARRLQGRRAIQVVEGLQGRKRRVTASVARRSAPRAVPMVVEHEGAVAGRTRPTGRDSSPHTSQHANPTFSIVIPVHNNGATLGRALDTVRMQTLPDWEVIVWDDGSIDAATLEFLAALDDPFIRKFSAPNQGVVGARNSAMEQARGEFTVMLDPDDALEPTYLEKCLLVFARFADVDIVVPTTRVTCAGEEDVFWQPPDFDERRMSYENLAPIASAFRTSVWERAGGMSHQFDAGYEDWGFWRAAVAAGCKAFMLREPLFRYSYSQDSGRDAKARTRADELALRIKQLHPKVTQHVRPDSDGMRVYPALESHAFNLPSNGRQPLVILLPWMLKGGGAENFLLSAIPDLRKMFEVVVVATQSLPPGFADCKAEFLDATPYVYDLPCFLGEHDFADFVSSLKMRLLCPTYLIVGSAWAYANIDLLRTELRGRPRVVDLLFNHVGHLGRLMTVQDRVDHVLVAHRRLKSLLTDYYEVTPQVDVLHIAPPKVYGEPARADGPQLGSLGTRSPGRTRVGWLGRNSPEKRADLVGRIAVLCPDVDFAMAGAGLTGLAAGGDLPSNVEVVGWVPDSRAFIDGCDLLLNTSDIEGISLSAMEALELGVPVATRDVGGMSELVRDGVNGFVYEAGHLSELAARLRDPDQVERVRSHAQINRLPAEFSHDRMIATLNRLLMPGRA